MENIQQKAAFLKNDLVKELSRINIDEPQRWGKMNVQQMIEHMSDSFREANGKTPRTIVTPEEQVPKYQEFLKSERAFKENTKNALMADTPAAVKHIDVKHALDELQTEINDFFTAFENHPEKTITNPFFGHLDYDMWVQLLHKHAIHHLKQFGVEQ